MKLLPSPFILGKKVSNNNENEEEEEEEENINNAPLFKWQCPYGILSNLKTIKREFIKYRNLTSNKIYIFGLPYSGKTTIAKILGKIFHLPIINVKDIANYSKYLINEDEYEPEIDLETNRRNSIENDLIKEIQKTYNDLQSGIAEAEENYNKRPNKKKTDPPFSAESYMRLPGELMNKVLKKRLQENETQIYGYIIEGYPKNYNDLKDLLDYDENNEYTPNSIINLCEVDETFLINRLKESEDFPKDPKDPLANEILDRANRRFAKIKDDSTAENYVPLENYFKENDKLKVLNIDAKKDILDIITECQEFIKENNDKKINKVTDALNYDKFKYDYIKEEKERRAEEERKKKEEEEEERKKKEEEEAAKGKKGKKEEEKKEEEKKEEEKKEEEKKEEEKEEEEVIGKKHFDARKRAREEEEKMNRKVKELLFNDDENENLQEELSFISEQLKDQNEKEKIDLKLEEMKKTDLEIEKENEIKLLEKKSEVLRRYLSDNVIPILSKGILKICETMPDDPVEALSNFLLEATFHKNNEEEEKSDEEKNDDAIPFQKDSSPIINDMGDIIDGKNENFNIENNDSPLDNNIEIHDNNSENKNNENNLNEDNKNEENNNNDNEEGNNNNNNEENA